MGSGIIASNSLECESESLYSGQTSQTRVTVLLDRQARLVCDSTVQWTDKPD